jgi:DNA-binding NtrC family response regulator
MNPRPFEAYTWPIFSLNCSYELWLARRCQGVAERSQALIELSDGHSLNLTLPSVKPSSEDWTHVSSFPLQERTLHDVIKPLILEALPRCEGNRRCVTLRLGIARDSLYRHFKRFGITSENRTADEDD